MCKLLAVQHIIPFLPPARSFSIFRQISFNFLLLAAAAAVSQPGVACASATGNTSSQHQFLSFCL